MRKTAKNAPRIICNQTNDFLKIEYTCGPLFNSSDVYLFIMDKFIRKEGIFWICKVQFSSFIHPDRIISSFITIELFLKINGKITVWKKNDVHILCFLQVSYDSLVVILNGIGMTPVCPPRS